MMTKVEETAADPGFDVTVAHPARIWDYWLGGKDNFDADRVAAAEVLRAMPVMARVARGGRLFLANVVHYLAASAGIGQFLDIGTGLPTADNTHEVAQRADPGARIVYVDNDPIVLAHARALLTSSPQGRCAYLDSDARDTPRILAAAAETLDLSQPVAIILLAVLHFIPDSDDPAGIITRLLEAVPPGSYVAISHAASDISGDLVAQGTSRYNQRSATAIRPRSRAEVTRLLDGLEIIPPGVVPLGQWVAGAAAPDPAAAALPTYSALARKR